jgi:chorismate mutase
MDAPKDDVPPALAAELQQRRQVLDEVNARLVALLQERARACRAIGAWKRAHGLPAVDAARETAMLASAAGLGAADAFDGEALRRILAAVLAESRALVLRDAPARGR